MFLLLCRSCFYLYVCMYVCMFLCTYIGSHASMFSYFSLIFILAQSNKRKIRKSYVGFMKRVLTARSVLTHLTHEHVDESRLTLNWKRVPGNLQFAISTNQQSTDIWQVPLQPSAFQYNALHQWASARQFLVIGDLLLGLRVGKCHKAR